MTAQQLKNSILQMAVQGKLVPQDPGDEPASVLLQRIKAEKQELIKAGKIKKDKKASEIFRGASRNLPYTFCEQIGKEIKDISEEIPFEIPDSWEWVRFSTIIELQSGQDLTPDKYNADGKGVPYITGASNIENNNVIINRWTEYGRAFAYNGDILLTCKGTIGTIAILQQDQVHIARQIMGIHPCKNIETNYVKIVLETLVETLKAAAKSMIPGITRDNVLSSLIPIPPLSEQRKIVLKIEQLLPFIEKYEQAETQLTALNTSFPEMLKKSILQEAVQGKLVPQNPDDEPASVLLERIRAEKQKLIKAGKIKKSKHESVIITRDKIPYEIVDGKERCIADEVPFEIPDTWCWCRLGTISCYFDAGKSPNCIKQSVTGDEYGVITTTSIQLGYFNESQNKVLPPNFEVKEDMKVKKGDILITRAGPMNRTGVACVVKEIHYNLILSDKTIRINMPDEFFDKDYIVTVLNSPNIREQIIRLMSGMDKQQVNISQDKYKTVFIPLPPLEEQHRIVAKIEELMQYCDRLK